MTTLLRPGSWLGLLPPQYFHKLRVCSMKQPSVLLIHMGYHQEYAQGIGSPMTLAVISEQLLFEALRNKHRGELIESVKCNARSRVSRKASRMRFTPIYG